MKKSNEFIIKILKGVLAVILGYVALRLVNLPRSFILDLIIQNGLDSKGFPTTVSSQIVFLVYIFIAGLAGAYVVGLLSKKNKWNFLLAFFVLLLVNDIYSVVSPLAEQPIWFKVVIFVTLPLQIWLGGILGMRTKKS